MNLRDWILRGRDLGASDLHAEAGSALAYRIRGALQPTSELASAAEISRAARELLGEEGWAGFQSRGSGDVSLDMGGTRCRINVYRTIRGVALAVRLLTPSIKDLKSCNLHPDLHRLTEATTGLVVISGPTGCGKSTTLAALIEEINGARAANIISLESPLEYLFANRRSFIRQREIPTHSPSFEQAIIDALRENPDVLVIGEMRTPEVMRLTLNAAETGHLVLATMHSASCAEALSRICMSFAPDIQGNIRAQLADCLVGVLCQRLEFLSAQQLRVPRCELLLSSSAAKGTLRAGQFGHLANVIQSGGEEGMWSFDRYQRWMEGHRDWVLPPKAPAPAATPTPSPTPRPMTSPAPPGVAHGPRPAAPPVDETEIGAEDLQDIAELARQLERRIP
ncbi:MAG TPA: ATPase, T2SS/T4P/T4SS family [Steroidobacteraceae bacterium]|nr:ATPase, T2SS/T4P/T4SS family [Steroidobacteraceae bacterium]